MELKDLMNACPNLVVIPVGDKPKRPEMLGPSGAFIDGAWYVACEASHDGGDDGTGYNYHGIVQYSADSHSMWDEDGEREYSLKSADGWVKQS